jgi:hypothetical protein
LIAYARALEIFFLFEKTHYVFHHGQSGCGFLALNLLTKFLLEADQTKQFLKFETVLRHPVELKSISSAQTTDWYKQQISWKNLHKIRDKTLTNSLIAVDGYLPSIQQAESALSFFFTEAYGSYTEIRIKEPSIKAISEHFIFDKETKKNFIKQFNKFDESTTCLGKGNLYTICVPKEYFNECGYLSEAFGVPAELNKSISSVLEEMQNETIPGKKLPQVRLLTHKLDLNKVPVFCFPAMRDHDYDNVVETVLDLVNRYFKDSELGDKMRVCRIGPK